jgi:hypothetical protein
MGKFVTRINFQSRALVGACLLASTLLLTGCSTASSLLGGEVILNPKTIEENIKDEVLSQSGINVVVECPDPMSGQVGDSRQCLAEDDFGQTYLIDVTIQNRDGYVVWQIQE